MFRVFAMSVSRAIEFFDQQFRRQVRDAEFALNPFESLALAHARGRVLDYGCGLGNFAIAAARRGCEVVALDGSAAAIERVQRTAREERLAIEAIRADLRSHVPAGDFDVVVSIGLLPYFDCPTAFRALDALKVCTRPGGALALNVLIEGTTWTEGFGGGAHCLFAPDALRDRVRGWDVAHDERCDVDATGGEVKSFLTLIARRPPGRAAAS